MNDIILHEVTFNDPKNHYVSRSNKKLFTSKKQKYGANSFETKPLISADLDSCSSDDEITLLDVGHFKQLSSNCNDSQLKRINKNDKFHFNGNISGHVTASDPFKHYELLEHKIEEGDTLQSISIKYQCSISDLKRANKLINNQEFYALKHIKIPVKKYSLLSEILPPVHAKKKNTTIIESEDDVKVINIGIGGRSPSPEETAAFFKRMDEDLVKIMLSNPNQNDSAETGTGAFRSSQIQPLIKDPYNTADCGIQWNYLLICAIIFAVLIPAVVALYMYIRSLHAHSHDIYSTEVSNDSFSSVTKVSMKSKS